MNTSKPKGFQFGNSIGPRGAKHHRLDETAEHEAQLLAIQEKLDEANQQVADLKAELNVALKKRVDDLEKTETLFGKLKDVKPIPHPIEPLSVRRSMILMTSH